VLVKAMTFRNTVWATAGILALSAGILAAGPAKAADVTHNQATVNQWRLAFAERTTPGSLGSIAATGPDDAWGIGDVLPAEGTDDPYLAHWNGKQWQTVHLAALNGYQLMGVAASSKDNAWIFASDPSTGVQEAFVYNGAHWQPMGLPANAYLGDTEAQSSGNEVVFGPRNVWVTTKSGVTHWNGSTWTATTIKSGITEVTGTSDGNLWAVGETFAYHLVKGHWTSVGFTAARGTEWGGLSTTSSSDVWIGGYSGGGSSAFLLHKTSHGWKKIVAPWWAAGAPLTVTSDGHGGAWANYTGHWTGKAWVSTAVWNAPVQGVNWVNMVKIPGTSGSYWAAIGAGFDGTRNVYPGVFVYGPLP
jgi:hypothetical protein